MKTILFLSVLFLSSCFNSNAEDKKAIAGKMTMGSYQCRYMVRSEYGCGVDLYECVVDGRLVSRIVCADNVLVW